MSEGNPYGCPVKVLQLIEAAANGSKMTPGLLVVVAKLGPSRVKWLGSEGCPNGGSPDFTALALDGTRATARDLFLAAGAQLYRSSRVNFSSIGLRETPQL
jgi:hypothetical protein